MDKIKLKSYAKINLTLDVIKKREDGYHDLEMVMQTVSLYDVLTFEKITDNKIIIETNNKKLQNENLKNNLVYKAIMKTFDYCNYTPRVGIKIFLEKNIPMEAGLAGGSSNGATAIKAINKMYNLNLTLDDMIEIGKCVGADIPYCLVGGTALVEGIGEKVKTLKPHIKSNILLAKPNVSVSTKYIFENLKIEDIKKRPDTKKVIQAICNNDIKEIAENLCNVLEVTTLKKYNIIEDIKKNMMEHGSLGAIMTGSGSAVFGYFENKEQLKICKSNLYNHFNDILLFETETINNFESRE